MVDLGLSWTIKDSLLCYDSRSGTMISMESSIKSGQIVKLMIFEFYPLSIPCDNKIPKISLF